MVVRSRRSSSIITKNLKYSTGDRRSPTVRERWAQAKPILVEIVAIC